ncbi:MAG: helix-turn-helix domain-containing protein [Gemmatimonadales bacterium]
MPTEPPRLTIAAVVAPSERAQLDAAAAGCFAIVHRPSLPDAAKTVREHPVDAIVFSVEQCRGAEVAHLDELIRRFPDIPTFALVTRSDSDTSEALLRLGASGVRHVVDVTGPRGWHRLRHMLAEPASKPAARILARFLDALPELSPTTRMFIELMVRMAPSVPVARRLARHARLRPSTLMSRFIRAGLPSPKTYVAAIRLLYAAQYFENDGLTVTDVSYRLECSSPQSFGRHLRAMLGITAGEFRRRFSFDTAADRFVALLVEPYRENWRVFRPLEGNSRTRASRRPGDFSPVRSLRAKR